MNKQSSFITIFFALVCTLNSMTVNTVAAGGIFFQDRQKSEDDQQALKLKATLVQIPVVVTDASGKFVTDLTEDDFTISEDGKHQKIAIFRALKQPFNAVLVLDTSNSAQDRLTVIQSVALSFAREINPDDQMMVVSFDHDIHQLTDFTSDQAEISQAIKSTEPGFGKLLYEAVAHSLEKLRDLEGRRAVILLSDGVDMRSIEQTAESTIRLAEEVGAVIYVVRFDTRWWIEEEARRRQQEENESKIPFQIDGRIPLPPDFGGPDVTTPSEIPHPKSPRIEIGPSSRPPITYDDPNMNRTMGPPPPRDPVKEALDKLYGEADQFMEDLSTRTGGRLFRAENFDGTRGAFKAIAEELRNQYLLGYYPTNEKSDGKYRKIKVEVKGKGLKIRARPGYRPEESRQ